MTGKRKTPAAPTVTGRQKDIHVPPAKRPKRERVVKKVDQSTGLSWREETDLKKALYASLQESKRLSRGSEEEVGVVSPGGSRGGRLSSMSAPSRGLHGQYSADDSSQDSTRSTTSSSTHDSKKTTVHAQRKFAQGQSLPNTPSTTPVKVSATPVKMPCARRAKTEDFLTFLCLRGSSILPPHLDFFGYSRDDREAGGSSRQTTPRQPVHVGRGVTRESTPDLSSSSDSDMRDELPELASLVSKTQQTPTRKAARASASTPETARGLVSIRSGMGRKVGKVPAKALLKRSKTLLASPNKMSPRGKRALMRRQRSPHKAVRKQLFQHPYVDLCPLQVSCDKHKMSKSELVEKPCPNFSGKSPSDFSVTKDDTDVLHSFTKAENLKSYGKEVHVASVVSEKRGEYPGFQDSTCCGEGCIFKDNVKMYDDDDRAKKSYILNRSVLHRIRRRASQIPLPSPPFCVLRGIQASKSPSLRDSFEEGVLNDELRNCEGETIGYKDGFCSKTESLSSEEEMIDVDVADMDVIIAQEETVFKVPVSTGSRVRDGLKSCKRFTLGGEKFCRSMQYATTEEPDVSCEGKRDNNNNKTAVSHLTTSKNLPCGNNTGKQNVDAVMLNDPPTPDLICDDNTTKQDVDTVVLNDPQSPDLICDGNTTKQDVDTAVLNDTQSPDLICADSTTEDVDTVMLNRPPTPDLICDDNTTKQDVDAVVLNDPQSRDLICDDNTTKDVDMVMLNDPPSPDLICDDNTTKDVDAVMLNDPPSPDLICDDNTTKDVDTVMLNDLPTPDLICDDNTTKQDVDTVVLNDPQSPDLICADSTTEDVDAVMLNDPQSPDLICADSTTEDVDAVMLNDPPIADPVCDDNTTKQDVHTVLLNDPPIPHLICDDNTTKQDVDAVMLNDPPTTDLVCDDNTTKQDVDTDMLNDPPTPDLICDDNTTKQDVDTDMLNDPPTPDLICDDNTTKQDVDTDMLNDPPTPDLICDDNTTKDVDAVLLNDPPIADPVCDDNTTKQDVDTYMLNDPPTPDLICDDNTTKQDVDTDMLNDPPTPDLICDDNTTKDVDAVMLNDPPIADPVCDDNTTKQDVDTDMLNDPPTPDLICDDNTTKQDVDTDMLNDPPTPDLICDDNTTKQDVDTAVLNDPQSPDLICDENITKQDVDIVLLNDPPTLDLICDDNTTEDVDTVMLNHPPIADPVYDGNTTKQDVNTVVLNDPPTPDLICDDNTTKQDVDTIMLNDQRTLDLICDDNATKQDVDTSMLNDSPPPPSLDLICDDNATKGDIDTYMLNDPPNCDDNTSFEMPTIDFYGRLTPKEEIMKLENDLVKEKIVFGKQFNPDNSAKQDVDRVTFMNPLIPDKDNKQDVDAIRFTDRRAFNLVDDDNDDKKELDTIISTNPQTPDMDCDIEYDIVEMISDFSLTPEEEIMKLENDFIKELYESPQYESERSSLSGDSRNSPFENTWLKQNICNNTKDRGPLNDMVSNQCFGRSTSHPTDNSPVKSHTSSNRACRMGMGNILMEHFHPREATEDTFADNNFTDNTDNTVGCRMGLGNIFLENPPPFILPLTPDIDLSEDCRDYFLDDPENLLHSEKPVNSGTFPNADPSESVSQTAHGCFVVDMRPPNISGFHENSPVSSTPERSPTESPQVARAN